MTCRSGTGTQPKEDHHVCELIMSDVVVPKGTTLEMGNFMKGFVLYSNPARNLGMTMRQILCNPQTEGVCLQHVQYNTINIMNARLASLLIDLCCSCLHSSKIVEFTMLPIMISPSLKLCGIKKTAIIATIILHQSARCMENLY
jgi:hypothetical protein